MRQIVTIFTEAIYPSMLFGTIWGISRFMGTIGANGMILEKVIYGAGLDQNGKIEKWKNEKWKIEKWKIEMLTPENRSRKSENRKK